MSISKETSDEYAAFLGTLINIFKKFDDTSSIIFKLDEIQKYFTNKACKNKIPSLSDLFGNNNELESDIKNMLLGTPTYTPPTKEAEKAEEVQENLGTSSPEILQILRGNVDTPVCDKAVKDNRIITVKK